MLVKWFLFCFTLDVSCEVFLLNSQFIKTIGRHFQLLYLVAYCNVYSISHLLISGRYTKMYFKIKVLIN